jgi:hypothetical protein
MRKSKRSIIVSIGIVLLFTLVMGTAAAETYKIVFIHHSCGDDWLNTGIGNLGNQLGANNYYVSDTYYEWGPNEIGSYTDIGNWWEWFCGPNSAAYTQAVYNTTNCHAEYTRPMADPGGENEIIIFKSCYPNSHLGGNPNNSATTGPNPLRGEDWSSEYHTVANAKGIYNDILEYFATRQDKLFIVITAPPLVESETDAAHAANARILNNWLVYDWLDGYPYKNVAVFDFYNVLTSNGGSDRTNNPNTNDLGWLDGNHHRWWNYTVQHIQTVDYCYSAYGSALDDSHPTASGNQKATSEFIPLLNHFVQEWKTAEISTIDFDTGTGTYPSISGIYNDTIVYPDNFSFIEVPDPLSDTNPTYPLSAIEMPAIGESFFDLRFGTILTRTTEIGGISGRHEYARFDPFNKDQSMIILDPDEWKVYSIQSYPFNQVSNLVMTLDDIEEPRWSPYDVNVILGVYEFSVKTVDVSTGETTIIKDFSTDSIMGPIIAREPVYGITMKDEGESSLDKRYWAFLLYGDDRVDYQFQYIFTWDRDGDRVLGVYKLDPIETEIDWVGMSPRGSWVLIGGAEYNGGNLTGLTMANKELTQFHRLDYTTSHSDVGLDSHGNEVIVMQNSRNDYIDLIPIDPNTQPILEADQGYENTNRTPLLRLFYSDDSPHGLQSGVHISCNVPGYCVVSTNTEPNLPEKNWLDRTIVLVTLDRQKPRAFYLAKVYGTTGAYWEETQATITNDGSRVVWASNWNQNVGEESAFLMQLNMPPNWKEHI